jgi:hypothetical protein
MCINPQKRSRAEGEKEPGEILDPTAKDIVAEEVVQIKGIEQLDWEPCTFFAMVTRSDVLTDATVFDQKSIPFRKLIPTYDIAGALTEIRTDKDIMVTDDDEWYDVLTSAYCKSRGKSGYMHLKISTICFPVYSEKGGTVYVLDKALSYGSQYGKAAVDSQKLFNNARALLSLATLTSADMLKHYASLVFAAANALKPTDSTSLQIVTDALGADTATAALPLLLDAVDTVSQASLRELLSFALQILEPVTDVAKFVTHVRGKSFSSIVRILKEVSTLTLPEVVRTGVRYATDSRGYHPLVEVKLTEIPEGELVLASQAKLSVENISLFSDPEVKVYKAAASYYRNSSDKNRFSELYQATTLPCDVAKILQTVLTEAKRRSSAASSTSDKQSAPSKGKGKGSPAGKGKGKGKKHA